MDFNKPELNNNDLNKIADAIYRVEGGSQIKYPYGIRSINTHGDINKAKQICLNTIKLNFIRWNHNKSIDFLTFLSERYCPTRGNNLTIAEKKCNKYWLLNLRKILEANTYEKSNQKMSNRRVQSTRKDN